MAKTSKNGVNKSAAIRELFKQNPKIKAQEVVSTLASKGVKVSVNLVYMVKGAQSQRRKINKRAAKVARASGGGDAIEMLFKVKALAGEVGGYDTLKKLVAILHS